MKLSFEEFWNKLVEHDIWYDQMKMRFFRKNLKQVANDCFIFLLASEQRWATQDYQDFRRCYQSFLAKAPDEVVRPQLQQEEVKSDKVQAPPLTGEARMNWIKEWEKVVKESTMVNGVTKLTHKQIADEGDWLPKKPAPYPKTNEFAIQQRVFHAAYIESNYDPQTGNKLLTWKDEETWTHDHEFELMEIWNEKKKELFNP